MWRKTEFNTKSRYNPNNIRRTRAKGISGMAWGQGELIVAPASVARMVMGIANNCNMLANRFVLKVSNRPEPLKNGTKLVTDSAYAALMRSYMIKQSELKTSILGIAVEKRPNYVKSMRHTLLQFIKHRARSRRGRPNYFGRIGSINI